MAKIINNEVKYNGFIYNSESRQIEVDGNVINRDLITKKPCVVVLVYNKSKDKYVMTQEFRVGSMQDEYGFVAGIIDEGETPIQAALRELKEEVGYSANTFDELGFSYSSSGFTNEKIHYFYVEVDGESQGQDLDHDEKIEIKYFSMNEILEMFKNGDFHSSHAHTCILKYQLVKGVNLFV